MTSAHPRSLLARVPNPGLFCAGAIIMLAVVALIVVGMLWMPYEPTAMSPDRLQGVSAAHLLGTDKMGRDILSRVMYGSRVTFLVALGTMAIGAGLGILIGAVTGYYGGVVDEIVMRITDGLFAFPTVLLALVIVSLFGSSTINVMWALGIAFVPSFTRVARSEVIRCKHLDYVKNARLMGQPPFASLGQMISEAQEVFFTVPSAVLGPGLVIVLMVLGFSLMGEGLRASEGRMA